jgi:sugar phosphate isomerase/epimerase
MSELTDTPAPAGFVDPAPPRAASDLAVQLYTLRARLAEDVDRTLAAVAEVGLHVVEPFDLVRFGDELASSMRRNGLRAETAHVDVLATDPGQVADAAALTGIGTVVQPWTDPERWTTLDDVRRVAQDLNEAARRLAPSGLRVGYHNHQFELETRFDGRHALEAFADELDEAVVLEVDTYWALAGGADVPELLRRLGDRVVALHVKDGDGTLDTKRQVAVGRGRLPVRDILDAAPDALRVIELDDTDGDLLDAVRASRSFLVELAGG